MMLNHLSKAFLFRSQRLWYLVLLNTTETITHLGGVGT